MLLSRHFSSDDFHSLYRSFSSSSYLMMSSCPMCCSRLCHNDFACLLYRSFSFCFHCFFSHFVSSVLLCLLLAAMSACLLFRISFRFIFLLLIVLLVCFCACFVYLVFLVLIGACLRYIVISRGGESRRRLEVVHHIVLARSFSCFLVTFLRRFLSPASYHFFCVRFFFSFL